MALKGECTKLHYNTDEVLKVISITGPESSIAEIERTTLNNTGAAKYKEYRPSCILESGTFSFEIYYDPSDDVHVALRATLDDIPEIQSFKITYSDGTTHTFDAFITNLSVSGIELESEVMLSVDCRITGGITEVVPAP